MASTPGSEEGQRVRLTGAGIADVAADAHLVITDDLPLYHRLANDRRAAINFTHLRAANW